LIRTARELTPKGRVITLFGCGGEKDRTKRPVMGEASGRLSDISILTNDNPRGEDPLKIISDIVVGVQKTNGKYVIEPDREKAISLALDEARAGDIVLLAGKGHETTQILSDRTLDWSDEDVAARALEERGYERPSSAAGSGGPGFGT
jgi:UDP-N-acetylmuramoyl-L-alanyl-D-glutamate--2,6-diaminopimelate ligase